MAANRPEQAERDLLLQHVLGLARCQAASGLWAGAQAQHVQRPCEGAAHACRRPLVNPAEVHCPSDGHRQLQPGQKLQGVQGQPSSVRVSLQKAPNI